MAATNGNDFITFQGAQQTLNTSIFNAYTGESFSLSGTYNVNTAVYDGLGGNDTLLFTSSGDYLALRNASNTQSVFNTEVFILGNGNDVLNLSDSVITLGSMTVSGGEGNDLIWGNRGNDTLFGSAGNDIINGGGGSDILQGNDGNDSFYFGTGYGFATIDGGSEFDEIVFAPGLTLSSLTIVPSVVAGFDFDITLSDGSLIQAVSVEQLRFSDGSLATIPEHSSYALLAGLVALGAVASRRLRKGPVLG